MAIVSGQRKPNGFSANNGLLANAAIDVGSDESKYQAAVDMARNQAPEGGFQDRRAFKKAIDENFATLSPTKTGREMRGESPWSDFVEGVNDVTRGVNVGIGNAIDTVWDNTVGNLAGLASKDLGDAAKNFMTGEDIAIVPDILSDVLLSSTGFGIPLVVAKEMFRSADDINEALSNRDSVTLEQLDDGQGAAKALTSALAIGLSAVPGIGKVKNIAKAADSKLAKDAAKQAAEASSEFEKTLEAARKANKEAKGKLGQARAAARQSSGIGSADIKKLEANIKARKKAGEDVSALEAQLKVLKDAKSEARTSSEAFSKSQAESAAAAEKADKAQEFADKSTAGRMFDVAAEDLRGFGQAIRNIPEFFKASRGRYAARRDLASRVKEAGKDTAKFDDVEKNLLESFEGADEVAKSKALKEALERAGLESLPTKGKDAAKKFDIAGIRGGRVMPLRGLTGSYRDVIRDFQRTANPSKLRDQYATYIAGLEGLEKEAAKDAAAEAASGASGVAKKIARHLEKQASGVDPLSKADIAKNVVLGQAVSGAMVPLAYTAQYGGDYIDNINQLAKDIESGKIRTGSLIASTFPLGGGRRIAQGAIPGISGKVGAYHPFGALRAKDTLAQYKALAGEDEEKRKKDDALASIKAKG